MEKLKVYGMKICPDCLEAIHQMKEQKIPFEFLDFSNGTIYLKQFLKIRDTDPAFGELHGQESIGIPCFVTSDGFATRSLEQALNHMKGIKSMSYQTILFDLDGTLTDSFEGIAKSAAYALEDAGIHIEDLQQLRPFVGPPLKDCFMELYHLTSEQADRAVEKYRERYRPVGIWENKLYEGIPQMLKQLKDAGKTLCVASSKPRVFVEQILEHFEIASFFDYAVGCELDGRLNTKAEVVEHAMTCANACPQTTVLVGDRKFDAEGAQANGISFLGVLYGFGGFEELSQYSSVGLAKTPEQVASLLLNEN